MTALVRVPGESPRHAYEYMDLLRALAAMLVAASHVRDLMWRDSLPGDPVAIKAAYLLTGFGHTGVIVFFTLSGFWITRSVMRRLAEGTAFWPGHLVDRLSRLWLVLVPVIAIGGAADYLGAVHWALANYSGATGAHSLVRPVVETLGPAEALGSVAFLGAVIVPPLGSNGPLWSLAYEFWYYVWFPALVMLVRDRRLSPALVSLALAFAAPAMAWGFVSWLTGTALHFALERVRGAAWGARDKWVLAAGALSFAAMLAIARATRETWTDPLLAASFALFLFGLCRCDPAFPRVLAPAARFGSRSSYSLYALHFPLAMLAIGLTSDGLRHAPSAALALHGAAILAGLAGAAIAFSHVTERRTAELRRWARARLARPVAREARR